MPADSAQQPRLRRGRREPDHDGLVQQHRARLPGVQHLQLRRAHHRHHDEHRHRQPRVRALGRAGELPGRRAAGRLPGELQGARSSRRRRAPRWARSTSPPSRRPNAPYLVTFKGEAEQNAVQTDTFTQSLAAAGRHPLGDRQRRQRRSAAARRPEHPELHAVRAVGGHRLPHRGHLRRRLPGSHLRRRLVRALQPLRRDRHQRHHRDPADARSHRRPCRRSSTWGSPAAATTRSSSPPTRRCSPRSSPATTRASCAPAPTWR